MATIQERKAEDGTISYRVRVRLRGHPIQSATFGKITDAKKWAKVTESAILEGRYFKSVEARKHTLADLVDRYKRDVLPTTSSWPRFVEKQLDWWKAELGVFTLADLTPALIAAKRDELAAGTTYRHKKRTGATVNRYLAALSHCFTVGVREFGWCEDNPVRKVRRLREPQGRVRFLDDDERARLLATCQRSRNPMLYPIVLIALSTGMRQGEILGLRWRDVDLSRGWITLDKTKNRDRRGVPLAGPAFAALKALPKRIGAALVFPGKDLARPTQFRNAWDKAVRIAGIEDFRFHDLRHSAASYLAMNGATPSEIAAVLGHRTLAMVKRYAHLADEHTAAVVLRMNKAVFGDEETKA